MQNEIQTLEKAGLQSGEIIFGTFFLLVGLISFTLALLRRRTGSQILIWLAIWSGIYGIKLLIVIPSVNIYFPGFFQNLIPAINLIFSHLILVFALLTWFHLTQSKVQIYLKMMIIITMFNGIAGIGWYFITGKSQTFHAIQ